ncbi:hypothetical protein Hesp01_19910 [Herbidospora sp. NBRC 101105]|nr:hypothetical protein Hesp01_19910 [Herbidospora sp. NBRC 101105]
MRQRLAARARQRWPQLAGITVRYHGEFAYVSGRLPDGAILPLCRIRYAGSATSWGFAVYRAGHDDYEKSVLPSGYPVGTPQEALGCACGLCLGDTTAWLDRHPQRIRGRDHWLVTCLDSVEIRSRQCGPCRVRCRTTPAPHLFVGQGVVQSSQLLPWKLPEAPFLSQTQLLT